MYNCFGSDECGHVVDVPITTESLAHSFRLYDLIKLPLPTPEMHDYYCLLVTNITTIGFSPDADNLIQMIGHRQPNTDVIWKASNVTLTFLVRDRPTCPEVSWKLKATCRYKVHKPPYPRSVNRLHGNTFVLTNISQLYFHCPTQQFSDNDKSMFSTYKGFRHSCNESEDITEISSIHFPINWAGVPE